MICIAAVTVAYLVTLMATRIAVAWLRWRYFGLLCHDMSGLSQLTRFLVRDLMAE